MLAVAILLSISNAAFFVGEGYVGDKIPILCENQDSVYVSSPDGTQARHQLDSDSQSSFVPGASGPYAVQCGNETKVATALPAPVADGAGAIKVSEGDSLVLYAVVVVLLMAAAAAAMIAKKMIFERTLFAKSVEGNLARLHLRAGRKMESVSIDDPVSMGFSGQALHLSIPLMTAGAEWSYEYEIENPDRTLPASLQAKMGGGQISLLSELWIGKKNVGGNLKEAGGKKSAFADRRKLPKATDG